MPLRLLSFSLVFVGLGSVDCLAVDHIPDTPNNTIPSEYNTSSNLTYRMRLMGYNGEDELQFAVYPYSGPTTITYSEEETWYRWDIAPGGIDPAPTFVPGINPTFSVYGIVEYKVQGGSTWYPANYIPYIPVP